MARKELKEAVSNAEATLKAAQEVREQASQKYDEALASSGALINTGLQGAQDEVVNAACASARAEVALAEAKSKLAEAKKKPGETKKAAKKPKVGRKTRASWEEADRILAALDAAWQS